MPSAPRSVQAETVVGSPNQLLVLWQPPETPNGRITEYTAYCFESYRDANEDGSGDLGSGIESDVLSPSAIPFHSNAGSTTVLGNETSAIVSGLDPYTRYDCIVIAYTSIGEGEPSSFPFVSGVTDESSGLVY